MRRGPVGDDLYHLSTRQTLILSPEDILLLHLCQHACFDVRLMYVKITISPEILAFLYGSNSTGTTYGHISGQSGTVGGHPSPLGYNDSRRSFVILSANDDKLTIIH